jgi:hypothetical protein
MTFVEGTGREEASEGPTRGYAQVVDVLGEFPRHCWFVLPWAPRGLVVVGVSALMCGGREEGGAGRYNSTTYDYLHFMYFVLFTTHIERSGIFLLSPATAKI